MKLHYIQGDATNPVGSGYKVICHVCNNIGKWGKGFVLAVSKKWPIAKQNYLDYFKYHVPGGKCELGINQLIFTIDSIAIFNMIAQDGIKSHDNPTPIDYSVLRKCLSEVKDYCVESSASLHMPRIGCGLAGGTWDKIEKILLDVFMYTNIDIFVYYLAADAEEMESYKRYEALRQLSEQAQALDMGY